MYRRGLVLHGALLCAVGGICDAQPISAESAAYLDRALQVMEENSLGTKDVDWAAVRRAALERARGAQDSIDTYDAIRAALRVMGDGHSFLALSPEQQRAEALRKGPQAASTGQSAVPLSSFAGRGVGGSMISAGDRRIAQIVVPSSLGPDGNAFAVRMQAQIAELAAQDPCGWIVDLRGNGGGNMWPMLAGVGPILGEGVVGGFVSGSGRRTNWFYEGVRAGTRVDGKADVVQLAVQNPITLPGRPPVAVLIDRGTASSGEAIAIAFRGRADTRFFGQSTYGVANSTFPFPLSDGAQLYLVVAVDIDREGRRYDNGIAPDEPLLDATVGDDRVANAAVKWLAERSACLRGK